MTTLGFLCLALGLCANSALVAHDKADKGTATSDFRLRAEVLEVLEGGPVVLRVTLTYLGDTPVEIMDYRNWFHDTVIKIDATETWKKYPPRRSFLTHGQPGRETLRKHDRLTEVISLHHRYFTIPPGKADLTVRWDVYRPRDDQGTEPLI